MHLLSGSKVIANWGNENNDFSQTEPAGARLYIIGVITGLLVLSLTNLFITLPTEGGEGG